MKIDPQPAWHHLPAAEALQLLQVHLATGLEEPEVRRRRRECGPNQVTARRATPVWRRLLRQFHQPLVYILLLAIGTTLFLEEWVDAAVILGVVLVNAAVGFLQEAKAEHAIAALARLVTTETTVRRDGREVRVPSVELVPGDVVLLQAGDRVPADLRWCRTRQLHADESALTGESLPVLKQADPVAGATILAERRSLAYAGTFVTRGHGEGVVWATGDRTETGRISRLIAGAAEVTTPLTRKIAQFSRLLLWVILGLAAGTFALGVARGAPPAEGFMAAVALTVGAIPEGLPAAVTIALAIGVARMARRGALIRHLPAVETLGSTTVICSDKTGTLTENQMTVRAIFAGGRSYAVTGNGYEPTGELQLDGRRVEAMSQPALAECLRAGLLCNESRLVRRGDRIQVEGDPTEAALVVAAEKAGFGHAAAPAGAPRLDTLPFESEQMYRATLHQAAAGRVIYKVGALERLLERCSDALDVTGAVGPLERAAVLAAAEAMAASGLRVLALARRHVEPSHGRLEPGHVAAGLTFLGLQGMMDPPRTAAIAAVRRCRDAGIAVKMITGDHLATARAIAAQIGLPGGAPEPLLPALTGRELERIPEDALPAVAERTTVFARVAPEQKLRLVRALQARGHVVAMTGDGVNDAPALKQADIGVAMGLGGTEVAKGAAAMILTDDNFASLEAAVEEGRGVFANLTKFIVWTLPTNAGEALILLVAILLGLPLPAAPVQLLWINLTTAILLGLTLVFEPREEGLMRRPPRDPAEPLLTAALLRRTALVALLMLGGSSWLFHWELQVAGGTLAEARTAVVNVIVLVEVAYLFSCRSLTRPVLGRHWAANPWVITGTLAMLGAQALLTYVPAMNALFHTAPLGFGPWLRAAAVALTVLAVVETEKWLRSRPLPGSAG
ncbi:MAG: HAD-IC family P-type ATPase [Opitutaceae bacterium]